MITPYSQRLIASLAIKYLSKDQKQTANQILLAMHSNQEIISVGLTSRRVAVVLSRMNTVKTEKTI